MRVWRREWKTADGSKVQSDVYSYRFMFCGVLQTGSTGLTNEREANRFVKDLKASLMLSQANAAVAGGRHPTKAKNFTIGQACKIYYDTQGKNTRNEANAAYDFDNLGWIENQLGANKLITDITGGDVARLVQARKAEGSRKNPGKPVSGATINRTVIELLKRVFHWAEENEDIQGLKRIKWRHLKQNEAGPRKRTLKPVELAKLRDASGFKETEDFRAAFEFDLITGHRRENFTDLKWSEVLWDQNIIKVIQKGGDEHIIPISAKMREIIEAQKDGTGVPYHPEYVFTFVAKRGSSSAEGGVARKRGERYPITYDGFGTWWTRLCEKAEVTDARIHDIRKTAGSNMNAAGGLKAAQVGMGHADVATTAKFYVDVGQEEMLYILNKAADAEAANRPVSGVTTKSETEVKQG